MIPLQISFRHLQKSEAINEFVERRVLQLTRTTNRLVGCRVLLDAPHHSHHKGNHYQVRIEMSVPRRSIVITRHPDKHVEHEDIYVALKDSFDAAARRLQDDLHRVRALKARARRVEFPKPDETEDQFQTAVF